ncbi:MAG: hypothetical protein PHH24_01400 [Candidatus Moranbacteria bacterium]|jgi:hypothetical protein|nr:hypothetical protein [Candidatus Moranbacteria bacterium]MDD5651830.1 hypothetical protein [Candidatus Moranbacteria bacterium]MDX9855499.1 hypothetical protein [Candidatus Moranbacteria bacterium]
MESADGKRGGMVMKKRFFRIRKKSGEKRDILLVEDYYIKSLVERFFELSSCPVTFH